MEKMDLGREQMENAIEEIGITGIQIDETPLTEAGRILLKKGYAAAELFVSKSTASFERDELLRVSKICERCQLNPELSTEVLKNRIESGNW